MESIVNFFRTYPEMAIFLTIGLGFWIGSLKYKNFTLGTVTSVLLVGVLVGQMDIPISGPLKSVFFLLFLFAIGYSVGPQFVRDYRHCQSAWLQCRHGCRSFCRRTDHLSRHRCRHRHYQLTISPRRRQEPLD